LATYRVHDYIRLLQFKRKGQLRDRYMLLFDAMDADGGLLGGLVLFPNPHSAAGSGMVSIDELVRTLSKQPRGGGDAVKIDKLAEIQLKAMDDDDVTGALQPAQQPYHCLSSTAELSCSSPPIVSLL
jgi:hypothetical protein